MKSLPEPNVLKDPPKSLQRRSISSVAVLPWGRENAPGAALVEGRAMFSSPSFPCLFTAPKWSLVCGRGRAPQWKGKLAEGAALLLFCPLAGSKLHFLIPIPLSICRSVNNIQLFHAKCTFVYFHPCRICKYVLTAVQKFLHSKNHAYLSHCQTSLGWLPAPIPAVLASWKWYKFPPEGRVVNFLLFSVTIGFMYFLFRVCSGLNPSCSCQALQASRDIPV